MKARRLTTLAIIGALCAVPAVGFAQDDIDAELEELEESVYDEDEQDEPVEQESFVGTMNPDISLILTTAGAWFSDEVDLRGGHDPQDYGFNLQGLELAISADVDPLFRFESAILFSLFGVELEEAYASTLALPYHLQARFGQFKTRFGRLNPTHLHSWAFVTQPLVNAKFFGGESMRGMGAELSRIELWMPGTFRWYVAYQNISGESTGRSFLPADDDVEGLDDLTFSARAEEFVELSSNWDFLLGLNYANGHNKSGRGNRTEIYGADTYLQWESRTSGGRQQVAWQTEAMLRRRQVPGDVLEDFGLYSWLEWQPGRHWATALRYEYVTGVGEVQVDPLDPEWVEARQRAAVQLSYLPSHFSRLRLQYSVDRPGAHDDHDHAGDEFVHMVFLQAEVVAGAHGTHEY